MASIYSYLEAQKPEDLDELYDSPWCCLAVFQSLDPLGKQWVVHRCHTRANTCVRGEPALPPPSRSPSASQAGDADAVDEGFHCPVVPGSVDETIRGRDSSVGGVD